MSDCRDNRLMLGAHLLGGLDADEAGQVEDHLETCAACREEHDRLSPVVAQIAFAGAPDTPPLPAGFEERLVARASRLERSRPPAPASARRNAFGRGMPAAALAGAAAAAAIFALFGALGGGGRHKATAFTVRLAPTAQAPNASAVAYLINDKGASTVALQARGLPPPAPGERYILWLSSKHGSYSIGTVQVTRTGWVTAVLQGRRAILPGSLIEISASGLAGGYRPLVEGTVTS